MGNEIDVAEGKRTNPAPEKAKGVGDPQCYRGMGGPPEFKIGDRLRIRDLPDIFYNQTPGYTRGKVGTVTALAYESPAPEDEAWGHLDEVEWFYVLDFFQRDLWDDYRSDSTDTVQVEIPERWLEPA
jgi:hypothetical protein